VLEVTARPHHLDSGQETTTTKEEKQSGWFSVINLCASVARNFGLRQTIIKDPKKTQQNKQKRNQLVMQWSIKTCVQNETTELCGSFFAELHEKERIKRSGKRRTTRTNTKTVVVALFFVASSATARTSASIDSSTPRSHNTARPDTGERRRIEYWIDDEDEE
jgi:hypothetical protein